MEECGSCVWVTPRGPGVSARVSPHQSRVQLSVSRIMVMCPRSPALLLEVRSPHDAGSHVERASLWRGVRLRCVSAVGSGGMRPLHHLHVRQSAILLPSSSVLQTQSRHCHLTPPPSMSCSRNQKLMLIG